MIPGNIPATAISVQPIPRSPELGCVKKLDLFQALTHLVEDGHAAFEQCPSIGGKLHALGAAVEQLNAQRVFQIGDSFGDNRMRDGEMAEAFAMLPLSATASTMWRSRSLTRRPIRSVQSMFVPLVSRL